MGVNDMLYMQSTSGNDGSYTLSVTFDVGTDPNIDTVNTLNRVNLATPQLPATVNAAGSDDPPEKPGAAGARPALLAQRHPRSAVPEQLR